MTPRQYQQAAVRTIGTFEDMADRLAFCAMEIDSESGEVANLAYKHLWQGHELDGQKIMLEIGDVMWGVAAFMDGIGCTMRMPAKIYWKNGHLYDGFRDRLTRVTLRLAKLSGLLADGVNGYIDHGYPTDVKAFETSVMAVFAQLCALADTLGFTPQEVMDANIAKLRKRYPDGFSSKASIARVDTNTTPVTMPTRTLTLVPAGAKPIEVPAGVGYRVAQLEDGSTVYSFHDMPAEGDSKE